MTDYDLLVELQMFITRTGTRRVWLRADLFRRLRPLVSCGLTLGPRYACVILQRSDFHA